MPDTPLSEDEAKQEPPTGTLAALLTAALAANLGEAVSALVGRAYTAQILRIEPRQHGGAEVIVEFVPTPGSTMLTIEVGADTVEIPLPPGVVDEPTHTRRMQEF
jgi:hypothetical protein